MNFWNGRAPDGKYLLLSSDREWFVRICCIDHQNDRPFNNYNCKAVSIQILEKFIPNWNLLNWRANPGISGHTELIAEDNGFRISLVRSNGCFLSDEEIVCEFEESMSTQESL